MVGNFNGHLTDVCFLFADEAFFSGDSKHEGILKGLITESVITIERKGIDAIQQPNYLKILMATNSKFAVPASRDERRYCVIDVSSSKIGDRAYFDALHEDIDSEEVQAAFLYEMLRLDLSGWHIGNIPESAGLRAQRYHSMKSYQQWLADSLIKGQFEVFLKTVDDDEYGIGDIDKWLEEMTTADLFESYKKWCDDARKGEYGRVNMSELSKYLGLLYKHVKRVRGTKNRGIAFGTWDDAIEAFEEYEKIKLSEVFK
ncbi:MAG: DUF5906 domain-containing protein [Methylovulum sp.]|nr:DUF5906 domain-containing protein [Methylovulum sp.]